MKSIPAHPASFGRWFRTLFVATGIASLATAPASEAAVVALDFQATLPSVGASTPSAFFPVVSTHSSYGSLGFDTSNNWIQFYQVYSGPSSVGVEFLAFGTELGPSSDGGLGWSHFSSPGGAVETGEGYLGFKTGAGYYGYVSVSWDTDAEVLTFGDGYLETEQGQAITIGAVPEPSAAGLALLGAVGWLVRRRRA